jgi:hypothetical protein
MFPADDHAGFMGGANLTFLVKIHQKCESDRFLGFHRGSRRCKQKALTKMVNKRLATRLFANRRNLKASNVLPRLA